MSQMDCLEFLREQRDINPNKWFRVKDVQEALREQGKGNGTLKGVGNDLMILTTCDDIDMRGIGVWKHYKEFRSK